MSSRYGSHALAVGARAGWTSTESVDTSGVVAGFGGGHTFGRPLVRRTAMPAARRYALAVSRRIPVASWMRRSDQPSRPNARTCCCLCSLRTLLMAAKDHAVLRRRQRLGALPVVAGFQVSISGRFWVSTEAAGVFEACRITGQTDADTSRA